MAKAIFLDKDGTLIPDIPYNVKPERITLQSNSVEGLKELAKQGYLLVIISNQSGVARGYFKEGALEPVKLKLTDLLSEHGLTLNGFYYCPHHPEGNMPPYNTECDCRKPKSGMLIEASKDLDINLNESWMIGDILNDVEAGNRAGCKTVLINNGNETEWLERPYRTPNIICDSINQAASMILSATHELARM